MAKEAGQGGNMTFLAINKDGYFYKKVEEGEEGSVEVKLKDGGSVYHKLYKETDDGYIDYMSIEEKEFKSGKVKLLSLSVKSENGIDKISMPLKNSRGGLNEYAKGLALILPNLDFSRLVNISASKKKNDKGFINKFLYINYVDGQEPKYPEFAHKYGAEGDIPKGVKVTKMGEETWDFSAQDEFLLEILTTEMARFKAFRTSNPVKSVSEDKPAEPKSSNTSASSRPEPVHEDEEDELPF